MKGRNWKFMKLPSVSLPVWNISDMIFFGWKKEYTVEKNMDNDKFLIWLKNWKEKKKETMNYTCLFLIKTKVFFNLNFKIISTCDFYLSFQTECRFKRINLKKVIPNSIMKRCWMRSGTMLRYRVAFMLFY